MKSAIMHIASQVLVPLFLILSVFSLFRGHDHPGGGFIGGLLAATGILLKTIADDPAMVLKKMFLKPVRSITLGLFFAFLSAIAGLFQSKPLFTGLWMTIHIPLTGEIKLGTPILFDAGIYFVVYGIILSITFLIFEEIEWK